MAMALPPAALIAATVSSTSARSTASTAAPSAANSLALARPMPLPAPVTAARLPSSRPHRSVPAVMPSPPAPDLARRGDLAASVARGTTDASRRPLAPGHHGKAHIGEDHRRFGDDHPYVSAEDLRKEQLDRRHRDRRGEPHHAAPGGGEPQSDGGDQIDHREEGGRHLPGDGIG